MPHKFKVTGLMSGSSLDGVDLAFCEFFKIESGWKFQILVAETIQYPAELKDRLDKASTLPMEEIHLLDRELGLYYGELLLDFHQGNQVNPSLIASHGHTILHDPGNGITFQAGNGEFIADLTGIRVINDFRIEDVAQGGQGAPLVPVGDRLLFGEYDSCINLGGFANISYENQKNQRIAFDICPSNMPLNWLAGLTGRAFDENGESAREGRINSELLKELNQLSYYAAPHPKSLGREWYLEFFHPLISQNTLNIPDRLATVVEHIAIQVASALKGVLNGGSAESGLTLLTGGGVLNQFLIQRLRSLSNHKIHIPEKNLVNYKEALVFAFLGLLRSQGEINCYASVTGGKRDLSTGIIHIPNK